MNAIELAEELELPYWSDGTQHGQLVKAADMIRRQHEAIKQLREALTISSRYVEALGGVGDRYRQALKDTEGL